MSGFIYTIMETPEELEVLRNRSSFNYTYNEPTIELLKRNFTLKDSLYILAKKEGQFAAFCSIDRDWWEDNYFFLREIIVDFTFQMHGIGSEMMSRCIDHAKKKGATGMVTETAFENIPMQELCKKFQFKEWDNPQWKGGVTYKIMFSKSIVP